MVIRPFDGLPRLSFSLVQCWYITYEVPIFHYSPWVVCASSANSSILNQNTVKSFPEVQQRCSVVEICSFTVLQLRNIFVLLW